MDMNSVLTARAQTQGNVVAGSSATGALSGGTGLFAAMGGQMSFMDLIFAQLTSQQSMTDGETEDGTATLLSGDAFSATETLTDGENSLLESLLDATGLTLDDLRQAAANDETTSLDSDTLSISTATPALDDIRAAFGAVLESFLQGLPAESRPDMKVLSQDEMQALVQKLNSAEGDQDLLAALENMINSGEDDSNPLLIASGLSPEELESFFDQLREGTDAGESYIVGLIKILPPESQREVLLIPRAQISPQKSLETVKNADGLLAAADTEDADSLASQLNALMVGEDDGEKSGAALSFESLLKIIESAQQATQSGTATTTESSGGLGKALQALKQLSAGLSTVSGTSTSDSTGTNGAAATTEIFWDNEALDSIFPDGLPWDVDQVAGGLQGKLSQSGLATLTSLSAHASAAGTPHPTTQSVAVTLQKVAGNGENKNFTLKLDPPELGKLEIEMEFSAEKTMKAKITVEKPETYLMMQRDAHVLERALQDAGLDLGDGGLSFELAEDGSNMFGHDDNSGNNGEAYNGASDSADGEEIEIIETSMDLSVDPETGMTRYNILV